MTRLIAWRLFVDWDHDGDFADPSENISAYLIAADGSMRLNTPESSITGGRGIISNMSLTLRNADGRFSALRSAGELYPYLVNGGMYHAPCYLEASTDGGDTYSRIFTGVLKLPREQGVTARSAPTLTIEARSNEEILLQARQSTSMAAFAACYDTGCSEAEILAAWLAAVDPAAATAIDPGIFTIPFAWLDDESPVEELWSLAGACAGRYYADPDGVHRYEAATYWQRAERSLVSQRTYNKDSYATITAAYDDRELYNAITVEAAPRTIGALDLIWAATNPVLVAAGATETVLARYDRPAYRVDSSAFKARTLGGLDATGDVTVSTSYDAQRATLTVTNQRGVMVSVFPLELYGYPVEGAPQQEETVSSAADGNNDAWFTARKVRRTRSVRGNIYIQERTHAQALARLLLRRHEYPRLAWRLSNCPGWPALRLGDRITIADHDWQEQDGNAPVAPGPGITEGTTRTISADETIVVAGVIVASSVTVAGRWFLVSSGTTTTTIITTPLTIAAGATRTDAGGETRRESHVSIAPGKRVTVAGHWLINEGGIAALVLSVAWRLSSAGFQQDLEAIGVNDLYPHDGGYFMLGRDVLGGAKVVFY